MTTPLEDAQAMVAAYTEAEKQILLGKEVRLGGAGTERWFKHEDLPQIRAGRKEWQGVVAGLQHAGAGTPTFGGRTFSVADFSNPV